MGVIRAGTRLLVETRHGLEIVIHHIWRAAVRTARARSEPAAKIGHQHFNLRLRRKLAYRANASGEMLRSAIAQVVAIDAGDDDIFEPQRRDGFGQMTRFVRIRRLGPAMRDIAERTAARAQIAQDHERRRAFAEAFADIRAGRFLAHGMQIFFAQNVFDFAEALAAWRACTRIQSGFLSGALRERS